MNNHDKRAIEKLKELKKEYRIVCSLTEKEKTQRFLAALRGEEWKKTNTK